MHARELVELAAIISAHGPVMVHGTRQLSTASIEQYWTASKSRLDRWGRSLKCFTREAGHTRPLGGACSASPTDGLRPPSEDRSLFHGVLEEILTGEALTRVWTAALCAYDRHHGTDEAEPVARSILVGHLEARHRVLTLLVRAPGIETEVAMKLNHLRRRTERWTDLLVGYLAGLYDVSEFAIDPARAKDFAEDLHYQSSLKGGRHVWPLVLASLRAAFRQGLCPRSPNADLNAKIGSSILSCFQPELFDSTGLFRSLWMLRLANGTDEAQGMLENLLALERPSTDDGDPPRASRLVNRLRKLRE